MTEMVLISQCLMLLAEVDDLLEETEDIGILVDVVPVEPANFIVLAIGIVVAELGVAHLVARQNHRNTLAYHEQ